MFKRKSMSVFLIFCLLVGVVSGGCNQHKETSGETEYVVRKLTHASYSSTREFYVAYNDLFAEYWIDKTGEEVEVEMLHRGSALLAEDIMENSSADVITMADVKDMNLLQEKKVIKSQWKKQLENSGVPFTSPIVFLVRRDSKIEIDDWNDLTEKGIEIMTANPETSGGGLWNFLAVWAYAKQISNGDEKIAYNFMKRFYENVLIMYDDSRQSVNNFVENGQGDVLITWESEAYLSMEAYPDDYKIVIPSISVMGEPVVAVAESSAQKNENSDIAKEYAKYLYSEEGQRMAGEHFFRPVKKEILQEYAEQFDLAVNAKTIDELGGWEQVWRECFEKDGIWEKVRPEE